MILGSITRVFKSIGPSALGLALLTISVSAQSSGGSAPARKSPTPADYTRTSQGIVLGSGAGEGARQDAAVGEKLDRILKQLEAVLKRLDVLEGRGNGAKTEDDNKSKALLTNLDIITKGEQRVDLLRKQLFEIIDKESSIKTKLDQVEADLRPEAIEKSLAFTGSLRPEDAREARRKSLEAERRGLQSTLADVQSLRVGIETNMRKAEVLVEKLREKFEKDIESALQN